MEKKVYELQINEGLDSLFPGLDEQEKSLLEKSILEEGCTDPIITWNGVIVDGHNRYRICRKHNIPFAVEERDFPSITDAMEWMISRQLGRRNLTNYAKAKVALRYEEEFRKESEKNKETAKKLDTDLDANERRTDARLGRLVGLSRDTIAKSRKLNANADEETKAKLDVGKVSVNKAFADLGARDSTDNRTSFRDPNLEGLEGYTGVLTLMYREYGKNCNILGEWCKEQTDGHELKGKYSSWATDYYAMGEALAVAEKSATQEKIKSDTLTANEKKVIKAVDKLLGTLDTGIKDILDDIDAFRVHQDLFTLIMQRLNNAYIGASTELFSYLWDVERLKAIRFGDDNERPLNSNASFYDMEAELAKDE